MYGDERYQRVRQRVLRKLESNVCCGFCKCEFGENCEYTDVGVGQPGVQTTPNVCPNCGAYEQGSYVFDSRTDEWKDGWMRTKDNHEEFEVDLENDIFGEMTEDPYFQDGVG